MPSAQLVRDIAPPLLWDFGKRKLPWLVRALGGHYTHIQYRGNFPTFAAARAASIGYDAPRILEQTRDAVMKVKRGEARWERDAMVSDSDEMPWPFLAILGRIAAQKGSRELRVLDFGGSLGSMYFWCRPFLKPEFRVSWNIVEQPGHVRVGKAEFEDEELHFHETVEAALAIEKPDLLLMSGVLQFLEEPEAFLRQLKDWGIPWFVLDRTYLWERPEPRIVVQEVPREIYEASYPAWILSRPRIFRVIEENYQLRWRVPDVETWEVDGEAITNNLYAFELKERSRQNGNSHAATSAGV